MKIQSINSFSYNLNNNRRNINFKGADKEFNPYYEGGKVPHGANYEILKDVDMNTNNQNDVFVCINGNPIPKCDREKMIYSRVPIAIKDAEDFVKENPKFDFSDICQDLMIILTVSMDVNMKKNNCIDDYFVKSYTDWKDLYFKELVNDRSLDKDAEPLTFHINESSIR